MTHEFKHPKYYTELRKRNREVLRSGRGLAVNQAPHVSDQAISLRAHDGECERAPDPGLNHQASSNKLQATSVKLSNQPVQVSSDKHPNHNHKRQATSQK